MEKRHRHQMKKAPTNKKRNRNIEEERKKEVDLLTTTNRVSTSEMIPSNRLDDGWTFGGFCAGKDRENGLQNGESDVTMDVGLGSFWVLVLVRTLPKVGT